MNSKPLINDGRRIPCYSVQTHLGLHTPKILCVPKRDFEDLDAERRRLRQALIDRGVDPNDSPPVEDPPAPPEATFGQMPEVTLTLPKYRCHKVVWALKISRVQDTCSGDQPDRFTLSFEDSTYSSIRKSSAWGLKFNPQPGGYYVVYQDGYTSFSPAKAFEEGYTRINP